MQLFFEQLLNGVAMGAIYSLITLGLALVYGVMRILHVAHAAVYTAGAYVGLYVFSITGSLLPAVPAAMAACAQSDTLAPSGKAERSAGVHVCSRCCTMSA